MSHYFITVKEWVDREVPNKDLTLVPYLLERRSGKTFSFSEHVRALIYALLSNQTKWIRISPHLDELNELFFFYDVEKIKTTPGEYFEKGIKRLKCGNVATSRQMATLAKNIAILEKVEKDTGMTIDEYVCSKPAYILAKEFGGSGSEYKLSYVGEALAWEYLRNVGIDGAKPDTHMCRFFSGNRMGAGNSRDNATPQQVYDSVKAISEETGYSMTEIDSYLWNFCASNYGEICTATPHCDKCPIARHCRY